MFQGVWIASILLSLCWADTRRRWWVLGLWAVLLPATQGPASIPPVVIAGMTTLQSVAIVILGGLAVGVGREAAS